MPRAADRSPELETPLLERESELAALTALVAGAALGEGGAAIVDGPAGIGKTRLLQAAVAAAEAADVRPLSARSSELERGFPFGVVRQLLEPAVLSAAPAERDQLLSGAARHAAPVLDVGTEVDVDRYAAVHGLYWLVANLAAHEPLLLTVDDAQSADEPSLQFVTYLCRRLDALPVAVVLAVRAAEGSREPLHALGAEPGVLRLRPEPLSAAGVATLLGAALDEPPDTVFAEACRANTVGNPFLLTELARDLARTDVRPRADEVAAAGRLVPERVGEAMRARLERLSPAAQALARALVVLGEETLPVVGAVAGLDADAAAGAAVELTAVDLVEKSERLRFRHPLVQAALEADLTLTERERAHARAARRLAEFGASERQIVAHLLASSGGDADPWAVERLRAAARSARAQELPSRRSRSSAGLWPSRRRASSARASFVSWERPSWPRCSRRPPSTWARHSGRPMRRQPGRTSRSSSRSPSTTATARPRQWTCSLLPWRSSTINRATASRGSVSRPTWRRARTLSPPARAALVSGGSRPG